MKRKGLSVFIGGVVVLIVLSFMIDPVQLIIYKSKGLPDGNDGKNLAQQLGYPKNTKLLVINSDDTGGHPSFTNGALKVMDYGLVKSTSIIVNDRNDDELNRIAEISKNHPEWGIGIHLSLNNEYQERFPWAPVLEKERVPTLYNEKNLAWEKVSEVARFANPQEVKMEFEAQIEKAYKFGIELSHIDSHMGTTYIDSEFPGADANALRLAVLEVAEKYNLPMTVNPFDASSKHVIALADQKNIIRPEVFFGFYELEDVNVHLGYIGSVAKKELTKLVIRLILGLHLPYENFFEVSDDVAVRTEIYKQAILKLVKPGLNHFFIHAGHNGNNSEESMPSGKHHPEGLDNIVRQSDLIVWSSNNMADFLEQQDITVINYKQIKEIQNAGSY